MCWCKSCNNMDQISQRTPGIGCLKSKECGSSEEANHDGMCRVAMGREADSLPKNLRGKNGAKEGCEALEVKLVSKSEVGS